MTTARAFSPNVDEREPLLAPPTATTSRFASWNRPWQIIPTFETTSPRYRFVPILGCLIILLNEVEWFFKQVPIMRAIEAMFCIEYYQEHDPKIAALGRHIPERLCKAGVIEKHVATTSGLTMFVRMGCSIIGAIPLGYLADKQGRRFVLIMHKIGAVFFVAFQLFVYLSYPLLPIWTLYFGGLSGLIGGNFDLNLAMLFASYADVMPSATQRTTLFFLTTAMQYIGQAIFPSIAGVMMNLDGKGGTSEISLFVSLGISVVSVFIPIFLFPETLDKTKTMEHAENERGKNTNDRTGGTRQGKSKVWGTFKESAKTKWVNAKSSIVEIGVVNIILLAFSIFCTSIGIKSTDWFGLVQYPVIKLGWTFPEASTVISIQAVIYLINFAVLLPAYTRLGSSHSFSPSSTSLLVMLLSCIVLVAGTVSLGFSASSAIFLIAMVIYTLGTGLQVTTQAYIANLIDKTRLARVMAVLSIAATAGKMGASGLAPIILGLGIDSGVEVLKGLPFFWAAGLFTLSGLAVGLVGLRERMRNKQKESEENEDGT